MPDPIRVTRAVRRCPLCGDKTDPDLRCTSSNCSDGWVDVPVDEECEWCAGGAWAWQHPERPRDCPHCGGSGRRLHDWATAFQPGDSILWAGQSGTVMATVNDGRVNVMIEDDTGPRARGWHTTAYVGGNYTADLALVLSDPSHRPEPMRWKQ